jgi:N-acetyl-alpha-D-glucosaminyl L-malate synthase BshA
LWKKLTLEEGSYKMKIGITCYPTYGGSGVVATELGIELAKRDHEVHFISYEQPFRLDEFHESIFFHEVEMLEYPLFKYPPYSLSLSVKMAQIIESEKLDILHVHYAMPHATSAYLAKKIVGDENIKIITTLHGTDITLVGNHHSFFRITKFSIEQSDGVTCVSEFLKNTTKETFDIKRGMEVIHNFVDTEVYKRDGNRKNLDMIEPDDKVIIHISNFRPVKRISSIIKVFCNISKKVKSKLLLVGDGPEMCKIRNMVSKLDLDNKVIFTGRQNDIIPLLNISDLYMLPSKSESFGLSALEAMSCGVPVIGTSIGGLKEVVEHGISGYICDPGDIKAMSKAAVAILANKKNRIKMGLAARARAKKFDSKNIIEKYVDYYKEVLEGKKT